jgi:tetratricopeptide (TPR) repeat protein/transcriptional regulator with XRE-family HTH domain
LVEPESVEPRPEARLGAALREAREKRGMSLRALARRLHRAHSNLVEYERGHRLAPLDVVEAYEVELGLASHTLAALHERVRLEIYGEDRSRRQTYVLRPAAHAPHQLPRDVADFTGRETELTKLRAIVTERAGRAGAPVIISAIAGMAGVGKTTLAVHLAHELAPRFPDVQLYVNLHGYDPLQRLTPTQTLDRFLRALGVAGEALPTEVEEQASMYRALLNGKRALVVLDNASAADQVRPLLPGSPACAVLVTSRGSLGGLVAQEGAHLLRLDVLPRSEALELLSVTVGQDRVRAEPQAAARLVRLCGCLPLAVRIAGARLATRPEMGIADLARRLASKQQRLQELEVDDVGIRASFALSLEGLDAPMARVFRHLGLVPGPDFAPGVAAALTDATPREVERALETLVDAHLLEVSRTAGRFRFHDLLRLYSSERVHAEETGDDRDAALRRMFTWYLKTADAAARTLAPGRRLLPREQADDDPANSFATRAEALAWFDVERPCLVAAIHYAADHGFHPITWQLADALYYFFDLRKYWADWLAVHEVGHAAAQQTGNRQAEVWMLCNLASAYNDLRRLDEAIDCHQQAIGICREVGYPLGEGRTLNNLGVVYRVLNRFEEAIDCHQRALKIYRELGDRWREAHALNRIGEALYHLGRFDEAVQYLQQALTIHREVGDLQGKGWAHQHLGDVHRAWRRFDEAIDDYHHALTVRRETEFRYGEGITLDALGLTLQRTQCLDAAQACWRQALTILTELNAPEADDVRGRLELLARRGRS